MSRGPFRDGGWRVCADCAGICEGDSHRPVVADPSRPYLAEQRCRWYSHTALQCVLAAPHAGNHVNPGCDDFRYGYTKDGFYEKTGTKPRIKTHAVA